MEFARFSEREIPGFRLRSGSSWFLLFWILMAFADAAAADLAIKGARIISVSNQVLEEGTVLIQGDRISEVGAEVVIPPGVDVIEAAGLTVYPGLFDSNTRLGLMEIGAVTMSNDDLELGEFTPHLSAFSAVHVESEHIPVARANGITHAVTRPRGGIIPGQAAVISLSGWNPGDLALSSHAALMIDFPSQFNRSGPGRKPYSETKKDYERRLRQLRELLARSRHYLKAVQAGADIQPNKVFEAMIPIIERSRPVFLEAHSHVDIREAVEFAESENLDFVLVGAQDAWQIIDFLKEHSVRLILGPRQTLPEQRDDPIDIVYRTPAMLHEAGIQFAIATSDYSDVRNLPHEVGNAVAYGLPWLAGIESITLTPAQFLGLDSELGSIEKGKRAHLVVADGDILDYNTKIKYVFINGKQVSLETRHTRLFHHYKSRPLEARQPR